VAELESAGRLNLGIQPAAARSRQPRVQFGVISGARSEATVTIRAHAMSQFRVPVLCPSYVDSDGFRWHSSPKNPGILLVPGSHNAEVEGSWMRLPKKSARGARRGDLLFTGAILLSQQGQPTELPDLRPRQRAQQVYHLADAGLVCRLKHRPRRLMHLFDNVGYSGPGRTTRISGRVPTHRRQNGWCIIWKITILRP
jgi:hypothetical protein